MEQRTIIANQVIENEDDCGDTATVVAFGFKRTVKSGRNIAETLEVMGLAPQNYQSIRVGGEKVDDLKIRKLQPGEIVTVTNQVRGG